MRGRLIVFEGTDGAGKATQAGLMARRLAAEGVSFREIDFPRYGNPFAEPARLYLAGALGARPGDVSACAASVFYAVDRYASYKEDWGRDYEAGELILANRYTTSNAVHQASKLERVEREAFLSWLFDLEYRRLELPEPDLVFYLDLPIELTEQMMSGCCAPAGRGPTPRRISMSRTRRTSAPAGRTPGRLPGIWAGGGSTAPGTGTCAPRRISTGRSGSWCGP